MSKKADLDRLASALADYGYAYLMTTSENGHPHAVAVQPEWVDRQLGVDGCGKRSRANARGQCIVALGRGHGAR